MGYLKDPPNVDLLDVEYETPEMEEVSECHFSQTSCRVQTFTKNFPQNKAMGESISKFNPEYVDFVIYLPLTAKVFTSHSR